MSEVKRYEQMFIDPVSGQMVTFRTVPASDYDALAAKFNDPEYPPKHSRRLIEQLRTERDAALAELALVREWVEARGRALVGLEQIKDAEIDRLQEELAALKGGQEAVASDADIEAAFTRAGGKWDGDKWVIEDADLHPFARSIAAPPAQASAWVAERYTCIGKGGSYLRVGTSIGAGDNRGEIVEVYRDESNGQLYHRDTENFFVRMTAAPTPGASDGKGGDHE